MGRAQHIERWLLVVGVLGLVFGLLARRIRELPVSGPLLALTVGVVLGPEAVGVLDVAAGREVSLLRETSEVSAAVAVMAVALHHPLGDLRSEGRGLVLLLTAGVVVMAVASGLVAALVLGMPLAAAAILGACLAPTDPVLAANVATGHVAEEHVPRRVRLLIEVEAAANDGLAPFLVLLAAGSATGVVAQEAAGAVAHLAIGVGVGAGSGLLAGQLVVVSTRHRDDLEHATFLVATVALTVAVLGLARLLGGQPLLAVFVAGLVYDTQLSAADRREEWQVQEAVHEYLVLPVFVLLGVILPWSEWAIAGWSLVVFVSAVLVLRRLPWLIAAGPLLRLGWRESAFVGWFGPIGVASLLLLAEVHGRGHIDDAALAAGLLAVALTTVLCGVTAAPAMRRL